MALALNTVSFLGYVLVLDSLIYIGCYSRHFNRRKAVKLAAVLSPIGLLLGIFYGMYITRSATIVFAATTIVLNQGMQVYVILSSGVLGILLVDAPLILLDLTNSYREQTKRRISLVFTLLGISLAYLSQILFFVFLRKNAGG